MPRRDRIDWLLTAINAVEDLVQPKLEARRRARRKDLPAPVHDDELAVCLEELRVAAEELADLRDRLMLERQRYVELFDFAPEPYLETDARWNVREANRAAAALLRCGQEQLVGKPLAVFITADLRKDLRSRMIALTQGDATGVVEFETRVQPRDAAPVAVLMRACAAHDASGRVQGVRCLMRPRGEAPILPVEHADGVGESG